MAGLSAETCRPLREISHKRLLALCDCAHLSFPQLLFSLVNRRPSPSPSSSPVVVKFGH